MGVPLGKALALPPEQQGYLIWRFPVLSEAKDRRWFGQGLAESMIHRHHRSRSGDRKVLR
jgi:hypothetical protein